jgi:hypothetical protein
VSAKRAVLHDQLTANERDSGGRVRLLEDLGAGEHTCVVERFRVRLEGAHSLGEGLGAELFRRWLGIVE